MKNIIAIVACLIMNVVLAQEETTTIYLMRHAEKANDGTTDPGLSDAGMDRAKKWGEFFENKDISTYYSTIYNRTKNTAIEISSTFSQMPEPGTERNFTMRGYDPMSLSLKQVAEDNKGKNVLIVGHSNTIPAQINALIGENKYADMQENEYGNLYIIKITGDKITHELVKM